MMMAHTWRCAACPGSSCAIDYTPPEPVCYYAVEGVKPVWKDRKGRVYGEKDGQDRGVELLAVLAEGV